MKRRDFITLLTGAATWPLGARAQQTERVRHLGLLLVSGPERLGPFREALGDLGYFEGKNIESRSDLRKVTTLWRPIPAVIYEGRRSPDFGEGNATT